MQLFSNLSWSTPSLAHFVCPPHLSHLIQLISSLVETVRPEMGVRYRDTYKMCSAGGTSWRGLKTTDVMPHEIKICKNIEPGIQVNCDTFCH